MKSQEGSNLVMELDDKTLGSVEEAGGHTQIGFHGCKNIKEAYEKLKTYRSLGSVQKASAEGIKWLYIDNFSKNIKVTAFYK